MPDSLGPVIRTAFDRQLVAVHRRFNSEVDGGISLMLVVIGR